MIEIAEDLVTVEWEVEFRGYAKTAGGDKLHLVDLREPLTVCGLPWAQMLLVEEPIPSVAVCDWCRAERDKR